MPMTRDEILNRYRQLRTVNAQHNQEALKFLPGNAVLDYARRLGLVAGKTLVADSAGELAVAMDLAVYTSKRGRSRAVDRYRRAARFRPESDEAVMLDAMCGSRFSIWRVERRHESSGAVVRDVLRRDEAWLVDEGLERTAPEGATFAARLCKPDAFSMTSGIAFSVDRDMFEEIVRDVAPRVRGAPEQVGDDPRFAEAVCRAAVAHGVLAEPGFE